MFTPFEAAITLLVFFGLGTVAELAKRDLQMSIRKKS